VAAALVGRAEERARLTALLAPHGPAAVFVHGPGGIGKTTLVTGTLAALAMNCVSLNGRHMEPTVPGALAALGTALGGPPPQSATAAAEQIAAADVDVLVIDSFERLNLLDGWIRMSSSAPSRPVSQPCWSAAAGRTWLGARHPDGAPCSANWWSGH